MIGLQKKPYPISTKEFAGFPVISGRKQIKKKALDTFDTKCSFPDYLLQKAIQSF